MRPPALPPSDQDVGFGRHLTAARTITIASAVVLPAGTRAHAAAAAAAAALVARTAYGRVDHLDSGNLGFGGGELQPKPLDLRVALLQRLQQPARAALQPLNGDCPAQRRQLGGTERQRVGVCDDLAARLECVEVAFQRDAPDVRARVLRLVLNQQLV